MGKGTIKSGGEDGEYTVTINYNTESIERQIQRLNDMIEEYENRITEIENTLYGG